MARKYFPVIYFTNFSLLLLIAITQIINAQSIHTEWTGRYEFFDGQNGGPPNRPSDFTTFTLIVSKKDNLLIATFSADGTQTSDEYQCSIQTSGNLIKVFFEKDLNRMNESRFKPFKNGDLLFTLTKTQVSRKTKYLFRSGDYEILPLSAISKNRIYFDKKSG